MKHEVTTRNAPSRELAQRLSGMDEILLVWHPDVDRVELALRDIVTGASFHIGIAPHNAIDAFYHPYAHAAGRRDPDPDEMTSADG